MSLNFSKEDFRGRSFKGKNLVKANFSNADIRGADFTDAILKEAKFTSAKAGLQTRWTIIIVILLFFLVLVSGIAFGHASTIVSIYSTSKYTAIPTVFIVFIIFLIVTLQKGFITALSTTALTVAGVFIVVQFLIFGLIKDTAISRIFEQSTWGAAGFSAWAVTGTMTLVLSITIFEIILSSLFCNHIVANRILTESQIILLVRCITLILSIFIATAGTIFLAITETKFYYSPLWTIHKTWIYALSMELLSAYVAWQVLCGDEKLTWIQRLAIAFVASRGTSFRNADLTNVDFAEATLISTDFRKADLIGTYFKKTKKLDFVRSEETYLQNKKLCKLLVTEQGQGKNFDRQNLRGVNLRNANLQDASFVGTDLSEANLKDADLSRAKLVQTQLDGTDFTGATLTGAYIEDWNITTDTKFDGVRCEYVYLRQPTTDNPDPHRKPDNRQEVFADGEFGDFIKPIFDTLDLYHNQGVDPRAIAIAFKELAENNPNAELEILAIERRGEDKILLRAKTASTASKSELSKEYFINYNQLKALAEQDFKALIAEKEYQINRLETMIITALERPSFYAEIYNNQGDTIMPESSKKVFNNNLQNAQFAGGLVNADTVTANQIGGNITNYSTEQRQNLAEAAAEIQQLLNQLSQTYPTATTSQKMSVVARAVDEIENNPTLKARIIGALKAGGTEAFKELIDHPLVNILLASIEGWQEVE